MAWHPNLALPSSWEPMLISCKHSACWGMLLDASVVMQLLSSRLVRRIIGIPFKLCVIASAAPMINASYACIMCL